MNILGNKNLLKQRYLQKNVVHAAYICKHESPKVVNFIIFELRFRQQQDMRKYEDAEWMMMC